MIYPGTGVSVVEILEHLGVEIRFPMAQTCCGQPAFNSGWQDDARRVARHFLRVFSGFDYIVSPSGSCTSMVTHHYRELFARDAAALLAAETIARRTYELSSFLTGVLRQEDLGARFPHTVTYHDSCHSLRELRVKEGPRRLLSHVEGLELREMDIAEECCGFGGTFSVKFPEISQAMARTKVSSIERTGAEFVVGTDASCLMQLEDSLRRAGARARTLHLAEVLAARESP
jgi:L-lactate dehydrogenase complex protein LldE